MSKVFYYVNTGHRIGLDRFRRAGAVIEALQDEEITLLTNDFRIASIAKAYGFKRAVGIDVIRNIPNIAKRGDRLIYDSQEHSEVILSDMRDFFSKLVRFSDEPETKGEENELVITPLEGLTGALPISEAFAEHKGKKNSVVLFFGDDDYEEDLLALAEKSELDEVDCLLGFYYFLDYEQKLAPYFRATLDEENYQEAITDAELLITCSYQAALEASLAKVPVVFLQRADYDTNYTRILRSIGVTIAPFEAITKEKISGWRQSVKPPIVTNGAKKVAQIIKDFLN